MDGAEQALDLARMAATTTRRVAAIAEEQLAEAITRYNQATARDHGDQAAPGT